MRNINEISFDEFMETMESLDIIATEDRSLFYHTLIHVCQECRLAGEMYSIFRKVHKKIGKLPELAVEHHKVILAMWLLLNDFKRPNITIH